MNCPDCNGGRTSVVKTIIDKAETRRLRLCQCGVRFWTAERVFKRSQVTAGQPPPNGPATAPQLTGNRPATFGGTLGGSDSGLFPVPDSSSGFLEAKSTEVLSKRRRGRGDAAPYPAEFEELWSKCVGRRGNKHPAFKAWQRECPPLNLTVERYLLWAQTDGWRRGFMPHLSTWLNARGWQDEPSAAELAGPDGSRVPRCPWHAKNGRGPSRYPTAACPECKEHQARTAGRTSEPTPLADALPDWAQVRETVKPPTAEELRELREVAK